MTATMSAQRPSHSPWSPTSPRSPHTHSHHSHHSHPHHHSHRVTSPSAAGARLVSPSHTPAIRSPASVGQTLPPTRSPSASSTTLALQGAGAKTPAATATPHPSHHVSSPSYFGLVVDPSDRLPTDSSIAGPARRHWKSPSPLPSRPAATAPLTAPSASRSGAAAPSANAPPLESNPSYEEFRRQSASRTFQLSNDSWSSPARSLSATDNRFPRQSLPSLVGITMGGFAESGSSGSSTDPSGRSSPSSGSSAQSGQSIEPTAAKSLHRASIPFDGSADVSLASTAAPPSTLATVVPNAPRLQSPRPLAGGFAPPSSPKRPLSRVEEPSARRSMPPQRVGGVSPTATSALATADLPRAQSLPVGGALTTTTLIAPDELAQLLAAMPPLSAQDVDLERGPVSASLVLLDLRISPQFHASRIRGALNLCMPTTLLKRPSFNAPKLLETFADPIDRARFACWPDAKAIVVYDAHARQLSDAPAAVNTLKKFTAEGWTGRAYVIRGGFQAVAAQLPDLVETGPPASALISASDSASAPDAVGSSSSGGATPNLSIDARRTPGASGGMQVAGGCPMPGPQTSKNPFFGTIRQNMDLIGGVGHLALQLPTGITDSSTPTAAAGTRHSSEHNSAGLRLPTWLPEWLRRAADPLDRGHLVASKFLDIERAEQTRMQSALSANVAFMVPRGNPLEASGSSTSNSATTNTIQVAGIEKGTKNRYKDILPFEHARVHLQDVPEGGCDYINASHISTRWSQNRYIATQAPVPATFEDFWHVVWQQDVRVIVMLSAESEGGQRKSHPYWLPDSYGTMRVEALSERKVALRIHHPPSSQPMGRVVSLNASQTRGPEGPGSKEPLYTSPLERAGAGGRSRGATNPFAPANPVAAAAAASAGKTSTRGPNGEAPSSPDGTDTPHVLLRKLLLKHSEHPNAPAREITQLQYLHWPDFGAPAHPADVLGLVDVCNAVIRSYDTSLRPQDAFALDARLGTFSSKTNAGEAVPPTPAATDAGLGGPPTRAGARPLVVHCSAGCGRTGAFCTVDTVIDMLKQQREAHVSGSPPSDLDAMDVDPARSQRPALSLGTKQPGAEQGVNMASNVEANEKWKFDSEMDLVAAVVADFRLQRLSMVQSLRQYVLCYETILEWLALREHLGKGLTRRDNARRSYQG